MSYIFSKTAKLVLWILLPTFFISGTKMSDQSSAMVYSDEDYRLHVTGNLNNNLSGDMNFETSVVTTSKGVSFSILKLKLDNEKSLFSHSMEFLISVESSKALSEGTYMISSNQEGLLNYFEGVFGFANIKVLGELPLFAKSGEIQIDYLDDSNVKGTMKIQMSNTVGESVNIKGNFVAIR